MKLIIILIALGLERGLHAGDFLYRFNWFENYMNLLRNSLSSTGLWKGIPGVLIAVLPPVLIVALIYLLLWPLVFGIVGALISLLVLLYCLGPIDMYGRLDHYFVAQVKGDTSAAQKSLEDFVPVPPLEPFLVNRTVTKNIFSNFNEGIFAVLFWFVVLGPVGAVLYRMVALTRRHAEKPGSADAALFSGAKLIQDVLDWIPVRLAGLGFALAGNFMGGFSYWVRDVLSGFENNTLFLEHIGLKSLQLTDEDPTTGTIDENKAALALTDRTLVIYLVILFVFILGAAVY